MTQTPSEPSASDDRSPPPSDEVSEVESLRAQLADAESRASAAREAQLRALADFDNSRRRLEREQSANLKYASDKILGELLGVADSLELGLKAAAVSSDKALAEGMQLTWKQLMAVLEKNGVRMLDPQGEAFNPELHQAMSMADSRDVPPNHVLAVMQKGYKLHDRLLRPATVIVSRAPAANP